MRRMFWLSVGVIAGASGTVWAERKVRTQLDALQPDHLVVLAQKRATTVGRQILAAALEGREAMQDRESELREQYRSPLVSEYPMEVVDISARRVTETRSAR